MKRIILWISVVVCTFLNSCTSTSTEIVDTAATDAAAVMAFWLEANGPMATCIGGPYAGLGIAMAAGAVGAAASAGADRNNNPTPLLGNLNHDILPSQYLLESNPFEHFGIYHNRVLQKIAELGGLSEIEDGFFSWDDSTWVNLLSVDTLPYSAKLAAPICGKTNIGDNLKITFDNIESANSLEQVLEPLNLDQEWKDTITAIGYKYVDLKSNNASITEITTYLNNEITLHLSKYPEEATEGEIAAVIFATVLKHSNYYWYDSN